MWCSTVVATSCPANHYSCEVGCYFYCPWFCECTVQLLTVQFKMVFMCSEKPVCTSPHLSGVSQMFLSLVVAFSHPFKQDHWALPLHMPLSSRWLCLQVVAQAPQHFRPFKMPTTCDSCFAHQSMCSVICKLQIHAKLVTSQVKNPHDLQLDDWFTHLFKSTMGYCRCRT